MRITLQDVSRWVGERPIIVEAGAHKGTDTVAIHRQWPHATIYAFEPVPELYKKLQEKTAGIAQIKTIPAALGDYTGHAQFFVSSGASSAASSLLPPEEYKISRPDIRYDREIQVPILTLDGWAASEKIEHVDFLWLDMQGYEYFMLTTSRIILPTVRVILTEVNLVQRFERHPLYPEFKKWLELQGFTIIAEDFFAHSWGNILCVRI